MARVITLSDLVASGLGDQPAGVNVPLGCSGASLEVMVELWCSQTAAALIFPTAAVIFHTCVAAELPAAPNPSVTDLQSPLKQCGSDVRLMLRQIIFFFPELMEIEEG